MTMMDSSLYVVADNGMSYILVLVGGILLVLLLAVSFVWMRVRQRRLRTSLAHLSGVQRRDVEYELVLKAMKLATWKMDVPTRQVMFDSDYRQENNLFNAPPGMLYTSSLGIISPLDRDRVAAALENLCTGLADEYHEQYRVRMPHSDFEYWAEAYATVAERDAKGKPLTIVGTTACINDKKRMEQKLREALYKSEESDRLKSTFISNISHEVRTPLNAIVGFSEVLPSIADEEERNKLMAIVRENTMALLQVFNDMMSVSRLEAARDDTMPSIRDYNLMEDLQRLARTFERTKPGVRMVFDSGSGALPVRTRRERVYQILEHFLTNAFKFTEKGSVKLSYSRSAGYVRLVVTDTGIGIPEKDHERIFERFVKLDNFTRGAGLGLSLCRAYAHSLAGMVGVDSRPGQGASFWLKIPEKI